MKALIFFVCLTYKEEVSAQFVTQHTPFTMLGHDQSPSGRQPGSRPKSRRSSRSKAKDPKTPQTVPTIGDQTHVQKEDEDYKAGNDDDMFVYGNLQCSPPNWVPPKQEPLLPWEGRDSDQGPFFNGIRMFDLVSSYADNVIALVYQLDIPEYEQVQYAASGLTNEAM